MHSFAISDFVIGELFCNSLIALRYIAKEAIFEQTAFTNLLHSKVSFQQFYSSSIVFFPTNSLYKTSRLLFILVHIHIVTRPFSSRRDTHFLVA